LFHKGSISEFLQHCQSVSFEPPSEKILPLPNHPFTLTDRKAIAATVADLGQTSEGTLSFDIDG
jgi:hypothetical protein